MRFSIIILCATAIGTSTLVNAAPIPFTNSLTVLLHRFDLTTALAAFIRPRLAEEAHSRKRDYNDGTKNNNNCYDNYGNRVNCGNNGNNCYDAYGNRVQCGASNNNNGGYCTDSYGNRYLCGDDNENYCYNRSGNQCGCDDADYDEVRTQNAKEDAKRRKQQQQDDDERQKQQEKEQKEREKEQKEREKQREQEQKEREKEQKEKEKEEEERKKIDDDDDN
ncbi:hypothetical protein IFR04_004440 [Cadophora malorum]|uniref:Uncharacterized protein n=1 Tax=Cadophora malorum TaxID=108018 RepID=A0A8H7WCQ9_9HELO|nr:hypothetical protein IFR04_004440 [Cadophora malorum]